MLGQTARYLAKGQQCSRQAAAPWTELSHAFGDKAYEDIQNPEKTKGNYMPYPEAKGPGPLEEVAGMEKEVKLGQNTPKSIGGFAQDVAHAAKDLADSVEATVKAAGNKAVDYKEAAKRAIGMHMHSDGKPLSEDHIHGAAGKMEYGEGWPRPNRAQVEERYQDISAPEKPNFPEGERSVNDMFPTMREAAQLQNWSGEEKVGDQTSMETEDAKGGGNGQLNENLHNKGP